MSKKKSKKLPDIYVEPIDRVTEVSIRNEIKEKGDFVLEQRSIPLRINGEEKNAIYVTKKFLEDMEKRKSQVGLDYNIYTLSRNGRYLNLPRGLGDRKSTRLNSSHGY